MVWFVLQVLPTELLEHAAPAGALCYTACTPSWGCTGARSGRVLPAPGGVHASPSGWNPGGIRGGRSDRGAGCEGPRSGTRVSELQRHPREPRCDWKAIDLCVSSTLTCTSVDCPLAWEGYESCVSCRASIRAGAHGRFVLRALWCSSPSQCNATSGKHPPPLPLGRSSASTLHDNKLRAPDLRHQVSHRQTGGKGAGEAREGGCGGCFRRPFGVHRRETQLEGGVVGAGASGMAA